MTSDLVLSLRAFPMHFDEKSMFAGRKLEAATLKVRTEASGGSRQWVESGVLGGGGVS